MSKKFYYKINLIFMYTLSVFFIMIISLVLSGILIFLISKITIPTEKTYFLHFPALLFIFSVSLVIGIFVTLISGKITLKSFRIMMEAMENLAKGDFDVRIQLKGILCSKEHRDFSESFNKTAKQLGDTFMLHSDFINNFSHELKTPIVSLVGFAKELKNENLTKEERDEYLDIIIKESERLSSMAMNILCINKTENLTITDKRQKFRLGEQIRRCILMTESKWSEKNINLDLEIEDIDFFGNEELLSQVWLNLIDNSIKFTSDNGNIQIKLEKEDGRIIFIIADDGTGMSEETIPHIFEKFYQGDVSHSVEGNGLGMSIVKNIINLHAGEIIVESELNLGTKITVILPEEL